MYICKFWLEVWVTLLYTISLCNNFQYTTAESIAGDFTLQAFVNCQLALETLQIAPKPGKETKPQPLHYTLNAKVATAGHSITSQLRLQADGLVHSF